VLFEGLEKNGFGRRAAAHVAKGETGSVAMRWRGLGWQGCSHGGVSGR
jgi:hypothetical protein